MSDGITLIERSGVLEIYIDRPDRKNALTTTMYGKMTEAIMDAAARPDVGTVLIAGLGDTFCAGNDLSDFMKGPSGMEAALSFVNTVATFEKPLIAAVQGAAVGVGTTMLFHCDLIYATADARFIMPFVNLGLLPEAGSSLLAPAILGSAKAASMLLLGEPLFADEAERLGFISAIVPAEKLIDHARAKAAVLLAQPPRALSATRRLLRGDRRALTDRMAHEADLFRDALGSPEAKEAFSAFFEKRPPNFQRP